MAQRSKLWYLKNINLFHGMSEEQMRMIEQRTVMREIRRREVLYLPGDAGDRIYLLKRGVVKISALLDDGREIILALLKKARSSAKRRSSRTRRATTWRRLRPR